MNAASTSDSITLRQRRLAMLALMCASILASLDTTITNVALPQIANELHTPDSTIIWVANAYQIAMISVLLPLASLGDSIGYRRVYMSGLVIFLSASLISGVSNSLEWLLVGRTLQGIGGAAMMSVSTAFIRHIYPIDQLGKGLSLNALVVAVGFTLGPPVASAILAASNWHWLFLLNVPIGLVALGLSYRYVPIVKGKQQSFEFAAGLLCMGFLGSFVYAFCSLKSGMGDPLTLIAAVSAILLLIGLLKVQKNHSAPILALDLLKIPLLGLSSATSVFAFITQSLALVSLPFLLQNSLDVSLVSSGFLLASWPIAVIGMAIVVTPLSDKVSAGVLCSIGLLLLCLGMISLAIISKETSHTSIIFRLVVCGIGFCLFQAPNMKSIMSNAPSHRSGGASGVIAISRLMGQTLGAAVVAQCFYFWHQQGAVLALWLGALTAALATVFSVLRVFVPKHALTK